MEENRALDYLQGEREFMQLLMDRFSDPNNVGSATGTPTAAELQIPATRALEANNTTTLEWHRASYFATQTALNELEEKLFLLEGR